MQLKTVFQRIELDEAMFNSAPFTRLSELRHLRHTEQLDPRLLWTPIDEKLPAAAMLQQPSETRGIICRVRMSGAMANAHYGKRYGSSDI